MDIKPYMEKIGKKARIASKVIASANSETKKLALISIAEALNSNRQKILKANSIDLANGESGGLDYSLMDRLELNESRISAMIEGVHQVTSLPDPIGEITDLTDRPSGVRLGKMRVPLGVIGIIYESRPNVTIDAASLCLKSGNCTILRGGSEAIKSNQAIASCIKEGLSTSKLPESIVQLVETTDRQAVGELITMPDYVDIIVPRGGKGLIKRIMQEAQIPMIKHLDGICHVYIDDVSGKTITAASSRDKDIDATSANKVEAAKLVGKAIAEKAVKAGVDTISFDRGGYLYHGRVKSLAEGAREGGLKF